MIHFPLKEKIPSRSGPFHPVIKIGPEWNVLDLSKGYHPENIPLVPPSIGRYNEKRPNMYNTELFKGVRNIHMGIDIWVPAGTPVYAFSEGEILCFGDNRAPGDYGPAIITKHELPEKYFLQEPSEKKTRKRVSAEPPISSSVNKTRTLYALFGHLSRNSLKGLHEGKKLCKGEAFADIGTEEENGGWVPHLHFQLSFEHPSGPDMPGVVSEDEHRNALKKYPDPRIILGLLY